MSDFNSLPINIDLRIQATGLDAIANEVTQKIQQINNAISTTPSADISPPLVSAIYGQLRGQVGQAATAQGLSEAQRQQLERQVGTAQSQALANFGGGKLVPQQARMDAEQADLLETIREEAEALRQRAAKTLAQADIETAEGQEYVQAKAASIEAEHELRAVVQEQIQSSGIQAQSDAAAAVAKDKIAAEAREIAAVTLAGDQDYVASTVNAARAKEELAARQILLTAGETQASEQLQGAQLLARAAVVKRVQAEITAAEALQAMTAQDIQAEVQARAAKAQVTRANNLMARNVIQQMSAQGELGGTWFQRFQSRLSNSGKLPEEYQPAGSFLASRAINAVGYGLGGGVLFGAIFGVKQLVTDAETLEQRFSRIEGQLERMGRGEAIGEVRRSILDIATASGQAADDVGNAFQRFLGAFDDTDTAIRATSDAMKIMTVTGADLETVLQSSIAASKRYGVSVGEIGDVVVTVSEQFGIAADGLQAFLGQTASSATAAGASLRDTAIIGAYLAQQLGESPEKIAREYNQVLNTLAQFKEEVLATFSGLPDVQAKLAEAFSKGDTATVLRELIANIDKLPPSLRNFLVSTAGGQELGSIFQALLSNSKELDDQLKNNDSTAGALDSKFEKVADTVRALGQRLRQLLTDLADQLFEAGLGELFEKIGLAIFGVVKAVTVLFGAFHQLDESTKIVGDLLETLTGLAGIGDAFPGLLSTFAQIAIVAALATKAINFTKDSILGVKGGDAELAQAAAKGETTAAIATKTAALEAETAANVANQAAVGGQTAAELAQAEVKAAKAAATQAEVTATGEAVAAKTAETRVNQLDAASEGQLAASKTTNAAASGAEAAATNSSRLFKQGSIATRLFGGGRFLTVGAADAAAGASAGASGAGIAGLGLAGLIAVGQSYGSNRADVEAQAKNLADKLKGQDRQKLEKIRDDYIANQSAYDKFSITFFGQEDPAELIERELNRQSSERGTQIIDAAAQRGRLGELVKNISDDNLKQVQDFINSSRENKKAFLDAGGQLNLGSDTFVKDAESFERLALRGNEGELRDLNRDTLTQILPKLKENAAKGDKGAADSVNKITELLGAQQELTGFVNDLLGKGQVDTAVAAAGGPGAFAQLTVQDAGRALQSGAISLSSYISTAQARLNEARIASGGTPEDIKKIQDIEAQLQKTIDDRAKLDAESAEQLRVVTGGEDQIDAEINAINSLIRNQNVSGTAKLATLPDLLSKTKESFLKQLELIKDPTERAARAQQGFDIGPELQALLVAQQLNSDEQASRQISDLATALGVHYDNLTAEIAFNVATTDKTVKQIEVEALDRRIKELIERLAGTTDPTQRATIEADLSRFRTLRDQIFNGANTSITEQDAGRLTPEEQRELDEKIVQLQRQKLQANADLAKSLIETNPIASAQADIAALEQELAIVQSDPNADPTEATRLAAQINRARRGLRDAARDVARSEIELAAAFHPDPVSQGRYSLLLAQFDAQTAALNGDRAAQNRSAIAIQQAQEQINDAQNDVIRSQIELAGGSGNDPVAQAQTQRQLAEFDLAVARSKGDVAAANRAQKAIDDANRQLAEAQNAVLTARLQLAAAGTRDPVKQAQFAQQQADLAAQLASGEAERIQAQIQRIQADRQLHDAIQAIYEAQANLVIAVAEAAGDSVAVARVGLAEAERKLNEAVSSGAGDAAVLQAVAETVRAKAALRDAQFNKQLGDIEFMAQIGDITTAQQIEMLQALASLPSNTEEQIRQIRLKIKSLQEDLSSDFQFNLPTFLGLPTTYESRRADATLGAGIGYQDNRIVNANIVVSGSNDPNATATAVLSALNDMTAPGRYATGNRRY